MRFSWRLAIQCRDSSWHNIVFQSYEDCISVVADDIIHGDAIHVWNDNQMIYIKLENVMMYRLENVTERTVAMEAE